MKDYSGLIIRSSRWNMRFICAECGTPIYRAKITAQRNGSLRPVCDGAGTPCTQREQDNARLWDALHGDVAAEREQMGIPLLIDHDGVPLGITAEDADGEPLRL